MDYSSMTLQEFTQHLGSDEPHPGGGGTSALVGALGVALGNMVAHLTIGRKKYAPVEEEMIALTHRAKELQDELLELISRDAQMFEPLAKAYSMPKETREEKDARDAVMKTALKDACQVPLAIMEKMCIALEIVSTAAQKGSAAAVSDAGDAAQFCRAALQGAALNVYINTKLMKDRGTAEEYNRRVDHMLAKAVPEADRIYDYVLGKLRSGQSTAKLLLGKEVAQHTNDQLSERVQRLREEGVVPTLSIIRVGDQPGDIAYENGAKKRCDLIGVSCRQVHLPGDVSQEEMLSAIDELNEDDSVDGVLLLRPLPAHLCESEIANRLLPQKDVDCMTDRSMSSLITGREVGFMPCTAEAAMAFLDYYGIDCTGKRAVVIGRSLVFGKPAAMMLLKKNATVTICHTKTKDLASEARKADILLVAAGRAGMVDASYFREGQVVIDVGINRDENGRLCGDVDTEAAQKIVSAITPVPGGVGAVTTSILLSHVVSACERKRHS